MKVRGCKHQHRSRYQHFRLDVSTNSSHLHSTQPSYRTTPNYPTQTKTRVPQSLFIASRVFSRADSRSGVHVTSVFLKCVKMYCISFFLDQIISQKVVFRSTLFFTHSSQSHFTTRFRVFSVLATTPFSFINIYLELLQRQKYPLYLLPQSDFQGKKIFKKNFHPFSGLDCGIS